MYILIGLTWMMAWESQASGHVLSFLGKHIMVVSRILCKWMENHFHFFLPAAIFGPAWVVAGGKYVIGGSLASALHGVARATMEQRFQYLMGWMPAVGSLHR
jgi:hypothetical protein